MQKTQGPTHDHNACAEWEKRVKEHFDGIIEMVEHVKKEGKMSHDKALVHSILLELAELKTMVESVIDMHQPGMMHEVIVPTETKN